MDNAGAWMRSAEMTVTFGGLGLVLIMIGFLFFWGIRMYLGKSVPKWFLAFGNKSSKRD
jgi:hypothetical protein